MNNIYEIHNLNKVYYFGPKQKQVVLDNLNLNIPANRLTAIYGPSGSGKSTLINIIGKLDRRYNGQITYKGKNLNKIKAHQYFQNEVSFIFQNYNLVNNKTVYQNLMFALETRNLTTKEKDDLIKKQLKYLKMEENIDKEVSKLSGGEKQRVAIARALVQETDIIIADEPTGALDSENTAKTITLFKEIIKEQNKTIIMVTHSQYVKERADYIVELNYGKIINEYTNPVNDSNAQINPFKKNKASFGKEALNTIKKAFTELKLNWANNLLMSIVLIFAITAITLITGMTNGAIQKNTYSSVIDPNNVIINTDMEYKVYKELKLPSDVKIEEVKMSNAKMIDNNGDTKRNIAQVIFSENIFQENNRGLIAGEIAKTDSETVISTGTMYEIYQQTIEIKNLYADGKAVPEINEEQMRKDVIGKKIKYQFGQQQKEFTITGITSNNKYGVVVKPTVMETLNLKENAKYDQNREPGNQNQEYDQSEYYFESRQIYLTFANSEQKAKFIEDNQNILISDFKQEAISLQDQEPTKIKYDTAETENKAMTEFTNNFIKGLTAVLSLGLIVASILIAIVVYSTVEKERKRLAIMQLFGYKQWKIIRYNLLANLIIVIFAVATSFILGSVIGNIAQNMNQNLAFEMSNTANQLLAIITVTIVMIVSFFALLRIRKVQPIEAIEQ